MRKYGREGMFRYMERESECYLKIYENIKSFEKSFENFHSQNMIFFFNKIKHIHFGV